MQGVGERFPRALQFMLGSLVLAIYLPAVAELPRVGVVLAVVQIVFAIALLFRPRLWLFVLPLVTVSLDLAPWSGRFLFSEFDGFIAVTVGAAALAGRFSYAALQWGYALALFALYALLYLANLTEPSAFLAPPGATTGNPYYSPLYSYKVGKGFIWGLLLGWLWLSHYRVDRAKTVHMSVAGVVGACWALLLLALWERGTLNAIAHANTWWDIAHSILNFSSDYRITGVFADMHTGGEVIDGLMILLLPLVMTALVSSRGLGSSAVFLSAVLAIGYCVVIGVTRATWVAAAFALIASLITGVAMGARSGDARSVGAAQRWLFPLPMVMAYALLLGIAPVPLSAGR